jgi:hypothetical protein
VAKTPKPQAAEIPVGAGAVLDITNQADDKGASNATKGASNATKGGDDASE